MKNIKDRNSGITLIALIVTIIVLIILATVSINLVMGEGGIIKQAEKIKENYANVSEEERTLLSRLSDQLDAYTSGNGGGSEDELEYGELALQYEIVNDDQTNDKYVKITPKIGGIESYPDYVRRILATTTKTKEQIFMEGQLYWNEINGETNVEDLRTAKSSNNFSQFVYIYTEGQAINVSNIEAFRIWLNENWACDFATVVDILIDYEVVLGYDGYYSNYARNILNTTSKTDEELFMEGKLYWSEIYEQSNVEDLRTAKASNNFSQFVYIYTEGEANNISNAEQLRIWFNEYWTYNYLTVDDFLIGEQLVEPGGYPDPYQEVYVECEETGENYYIELGYSAYFYIEEDGTYTFTGETERGATTTQIVRVGEEELDLATILANATTKHPDQILSNDIGIGTDGKLVNLDLWEYDVINDNEIVLANTMNNPSYMTDWRNAYVGGYVNGKIIGSVPQYVKINGNSDFYPVTSMEKTFLWDENLVYAPEIPSTVSVLFATFSGCSNLVSAPVLHENVRDVGWCFSGCRSLTGNIEINSEHLNDHVYYHHCFYNAATESGCDLILSGSCPYLAEILATKSEK